MISISTSVDLSFKLLLWCEVYSESQVLWHLVIVFQLDKFAMLVFNNFFNISMHNIFRNTIFIISALIWYLYSKLYKCKVLNFNFQIFVQYFILTQILIKQLLLFKIGPIQRFIDHRNIYWLQTTSSVNINFLGQ